MTDALVALVGISRTLRSKCFLKEKWTNATIIDSNWISLTAYIAIARAKGC